MYRNHENNGHPSKDCCVSWIVQGMKVQRTEECVTAVADARLLCHQQQKQVGGIGRTLRKVVPRRNK